jgi:hypothetical protein
VVPPNASTARVLDQLLKELPAALKAHNSTQDGSARFKLRLAVNVDPVVSHMNGVSGEAVIVAARLVEAQVFKDALGASTASLGIIASPFVYETAVRHSSDPGEVASYAQVPVEVKETDTTAWMKLFAAPAASPMFLTPEHPDLTPAISGSSRIGMAGGRSRRGCRRRCRPRAAARPGRPG